MRWLKVQIVIVSMFSSFTSVFQFYFYLIMSLLQEVYLILQGIDLPL